MTRTALSRRALLAGFAAGAGAALAPRARAIEGVPLADRLDDLPADLGAGRSVAVIGGGLAGLTTAWRLGRAGFDVTVFEAEPRYGGRSLTVRPASAAYRRFFRDRYGISDDSYVDRFAERDGPEQVCAFFDDGWDPQREPHPQELFLNAGPGRIPSFHIALLRLCKEIGVELEPFIFASRSNLVQADDFNGGEAAQIRRLKHDLRGELAEYLSDLADQGAFDPGFGPEPEARARLRRFLQQFGALEDEGARLVYEGSNRAGYARLPGAWRNPGVLHEPFEMRDMLASQLWDSALYNDMRSYWQSSLMQPRGGMDMIWQRLLRQPAGRGVTVQDRVRLATPVTRIETAEGGGVAVSWEDPASGGERSGLFDYCVSTMAPRLLSERLSGFPAGFVNALAAVDQMQACKVGWQGRSRFWENENQIFGGISWTRHIISQIWYPADGYLGRTGVLTGAYNRGPDAETFMRLGHAERLETALEGGEKLHPGYRDKVHTDRGVSIAWGKMPHQEGGWADETFETQPQIYEAITDLPQGRLYLAGDFVSYMPGWMEGAVRSAQLAAHAIAARVEAGGDPPVRR